jgi:spermidine/putrescine transport system substrate-binding protein
MKQQQWRSWGWSGASRRGALRWVGIFSLVALLGVALAACGGGGSDTTGSSSEASGSGSGETINLLTWQTYHERAQLEGFEQETGIKVNATNVGSPAEMFSKVKANPGQYDIVLNTAGWFPQYVESDLLEPIDESRVPSMDNIKLGFDWENATSVEGKLYGVLYNWGDQPLGWIPDRLKGVDLSKYENEGELDDWNVFWDPQLKGKVTIFDDPTSVEPMIALALGFENPYQLDEKEFEEFKTKLLELRPQVKRLTSGYDDQTAALANGEADVAYLNVSSIATFLKKDDIQMEVNNTVSQGVPAWSDNYAITKEGGADKLDAVYKFINSTLEIPWQAKFIADSAQSGVLTYDQATSPEAKEQGLTNAKLEETLIPATRDGDKFFSKMIFFQPVEDLQARLDVWNEFKLGLGS